MWSGGNSLRKGKRRANCDGRGRRVRPWHPACWGNKEPHNGQEVTEVMRMLPSFVPNSQSSGYNHVHGRDHCPARKAPTHKTCESSSSRSPAGNAFGSHSCCLNKRRKNNCSLQAPVTMQRHPPNHSKLSPFHTTGSKDTNCIRSWPWSPSASFSW